MVIQNLVDLFSLVPNAEKSLFEIALHFRVGRLCGEVVGIDGAENEASNFFRFAKLEKLDGVGQGQHIAADLAEVSVKPFFELVERDVRDVAVVKVGERKLKLGPKLVERQGRGSRLFENVVGRLPDPRQIIYQCARPIKDDVPKNSTIVCVLTGNGLKDPDCAIKNNDSIFHTGIEPKVSSITKIMGF